MSLRVLPIRVTRGRRYPLRQEAGVYGYRHPLSDAVACEAALTELREVIKSMVRKDVGVEGVQRRRAALWESLRSGDS